MEYKNWLMEKFVEWEKKQSRRQSYSAFARYLGVKQPTLTRWLAGDNPPDGDNLRIVAEKLGYEIYDILGIERPLSVPASMRPILQEIALELVGRGVPSGSPDEDKVVIEIMSKHGFKHISTTQSPD